MDPSDVSIGQAAVRGAIVGFFAVLALVSTLLFTVAGVSFAVALAVGAYVGIWGGPGWGGMMAAQRRADQLDEDERRAARTQRRRIDEPPQADPTGAFIVSVATNEDRRSLDGVGPL